MATRPATRGSGEVAGDVTGRARAVDEEPSQVAAVPPRPVLGDVVSYFESLQGRECPALVTKVWGPDAVNLQVVLDGAYPMEWKTNVLYDPEGAPGTWRWR